MSLGIIAGVGFAAVVLGLEFDGNPGIVEPGVVVMSLDVLLVNDDVRALGLEAARIFGLADQF